MANLVSISGEDTLTLANSGFSTPTGYTFTGFADGTFVDLQFPNDLTTSKTGKDGNTIIAKNAMGRLAEMTIRVLRGSDDDKEMQSVLSGQIADLTSAGFVTGTYVKTINIGGTNGKKSDTYTLNNGVIHKQPVVMSNADGDVNQSVVIYSVRFGSVDRALS